MNPVRNFKRPISKTKQFKINRQASRISNGVKRFATGLVVVICLAAFCSTSFAQEKTALKKEQLPDYSSESANPDKLPHI